MMGEIDGAIIISHTSYAPLPSVQISLLPSRHTRSRAGLTVFLPPSFPPSFPSFPLPTSRLPRDQGSHCIRLDTEPP